MILDDDSFPVTENRTEQLVAIPVFHEMTEDELARIKYALSSYLGPS